MDWIAQIVGEFGRRIGLPDLALDGSGRLRLVLADGTGLGLIHLDLEAFSEIVVYRSCPLAYLKAPSFRTALRLTDYRQPNDWAMQAGMSQRDLMLATRIPERAFTGTVLEHALSRLDEKISLLR